MKKKILVACLCVALAVLTVAGTTLAYLTSQDKVTNTFTVGNVKMTMDEAAVNTDGEKLYKDGSTTELADRVKENDYILSPGHTYVKDPIVHMDAVSENCYVFIKVENGLGVLEAATSAEDGGYKNIAAQITANGWKPLMNGTTAVAGVYYQEYTKNQTNRELEVFANFKIADNANTLKNANDQVIWDTITDANKITVNVTAYAIQKDGFTTAAAAWAEVSK